MICKKCGCEAMIKSGDWYKCPVCGAEAFDTSVKVNHGNSPTKAIASIENRINEQRVDAPSVEPQDEKQARSNSKLRENIQFFTPIIVAVIFAVLLKTFVFANAVVPTGSMLNTIQKQDRIIASRLEYINKSPERYDIVIFSHPDKANEMLVKRIVGLPNETIRVENGVVYVTKPDGETIQLEDDFVTNCVPEGDFGPYIIPEDCYFMMGDNRNNSKDSRFWTNKFVHKDKIIGKVKFRYYPNFSKIV